jgi:hypothetical protein
VLLEKSLARIGCEKKTITRRKYGQGRGEWGDEAENLIQKEELESEWNLGEG